MAFEDSPVLICDLDGTVLRINSFPLWIMYMIAGPLPEVGWRARARLSLRAQGMLARRKFGRIDHRQLMAGTQAAWHEAAGSGDAPADRVATTLRWFVRPALEPLLRQIAAGETDAVLATAAAGEYAIALGRQLGFRHVLTTPLQLAPGEPINAGTQKLLRVLDFLADQNWAGRPLVLLTDHLDDLPLMRYADAVGWFGSGAAMPQARLLAEGAKFIACRELSEPATAVALSALSAHARSLGAIAPASWRSTSA